LTLYSTATLSALTPLHSNALLSALHRQLNHPDTHPRLLRLHNNFLLTLDRSHDILVVIYVRPLGAGEFATPQPTVLALRIVELFLGKQLAVILLRLDTVGRVVRFDTSEELIDLRIFAVLYHSQ
jgi:hypothetical protein